MMWAKSLIAVAVVCGISVAGWRLYEAGTKKGRSEVQQMWDREKAQTAEAHAEELMKARQRESALQSLADRLRKEKADEARRLAAEYQRDLDGLRDRPEERAGAGGVPEGAAPGVGCTGAGLARLDAGLLTGYAYAAARLQLAYNECKARYDALTGAD